MPSVEKDREEKMDSAVFERLARAWGVKRYAEVSTKLHVRENTLYTWKSRGFIPLQYLIFTAKETGVSLDFLVLGREDGVSSDNEAATTFVDLSREGVLNKLSEQTVDIGAYVILPHLDLKPSDPLNPLPPEYEKVKGELALREDFLYRILGRRGGDVALVNVTGDAMEPTLINGDPIMVDMQVNRVDVSGIYVIEMGGDLFVKRIQRKMDGSLVVKCDNTKYEDEVIEREYAGTFRVKGRMVWPRVR